MKKNRLLNRTLSFGLALALFISSPASVYAGEMNDASVETIVENIDQGGASDEGESSGSDSTTASEGTNSESGSESNDSDQVSSGASTSENDSNSDEQVNKGETPESSDTTADDAEADADKKADAEADANADKDAEDEDEEITYDYESNNDGTHVKKWTDKDGEAHEETEDCEFGEDGKCVHCGYEDEKIVVLVDENNLVKITGDKSVLNGAVKVTAKEISYNSDEATFDEMYSTLDGETDDETQIIGLIAYDINLYNENEEIVEPDGEVKVEFISPDVEGLNNEDLTTEVYHYNDASVDKMEKVSEKDDSVEMTTDHFSTYIIAITGSDEANNTLAKSDYLTVNSSGNAYLTYNNYYTNSYRALVVNVFVDGTKKASYPGSSTGVYFYNYGTDSTELSITVNNGYYLGAVKGNYVYKDVSDSGVFSSQASNVIHGISYSDYMLSYMADAALYSNDNSIVVKTGLQTIDNYNNPKCNYINIYLYTVKENIVTVDHAKLVDYYSGYFYAASGGTDSYFAFNKGDTGKNGDWVHYGKVYQGLASSELSNNGTTFTTNIAAVGKQNIDYFPDYDSTTPSSNSYYNVLAYDTHVEFVKEGDYYVLDSTKYGYDLVGISSYSGTKTKGAVLKCKDTTETNGMWPFTIQSPHYAMMIPIDFTISEDGQTNGNDTVFEFMGDDDVFVYIDGKLVLDLGGVHDRVNGSINFRTGEVFISGENDGYKNNTSTNGKVYEKKSLGTKNLYEIISEEDCADFAQEQHTMTVVYFERGGYVSNCRIKYNFSTVATSTSTDASFEKVDENDEALQGAEFTVYKNANCSADDAIMTRASKEDGVVTFENLEIGTYYIKETKAIDGFDLPTNAIWELKVEKIKGKFKTTLTAYNDEASSLLLSTTNDITTTKATIKNVANKKTIVVKKVVEDSTGIIDSNACYVFKLEKITEKNADGSPKSTTPALVDGAKYPGISVSKGSVETPIYENGQFAIYGDETVTFSGLGSGEYLLTELGVAWSSYNLDLNDYYTEIYEDDSSTPVVFDSTSSERTIVINLTGNDVISKSITYKNIRNVYEWQICKVDSVTRNSLSGASFELTGTNHYYGFSDSDGIVKWYTNKEKTDDSMVNVIPDGEYTLKETVAPSMYRLSTEEWSVSVNNTEGVTIKDSMGNVITLASSEKYSIATYEFENEVAYTLPETGGSGVYVYTIGGILLMIAGALLLYKNKNNKNK